MPAACRGPVWCPILLLGAVLLLLLLSWLAGCHLPPNTWPVGCQAAPASTHCVPQLSFPLCITPDATNLGGSLCGCVNGWWPAALYHMSTGSSCGWIKAWQAAGDASALDP